jgi:hypothetical protein
MSDGAGLELEELEVEQATLGRASVCRYVSFAGVAG